MTTIMPQRRLATAFFLLCSVIGSVRAQVDVRVDDNNPNIAYSPAASWFRNEETSPFDAGGFHMATTDTTASATFRFTGTGIRYIAPLWADEVTTQVQLDGGVPVFINLQDTTVPAEDHGPASVESSVRWEARGLANTDHTLVIRVAPGGIWAVVDMLVVEQGTFSDTTTKVNGPLPATTSKETSSTSPSQETASTSSTQSREAASTSSNTTTKVNGTLFTTAIKEMASTSSGTQSREAAATSSTASPTPATTSSRTTIILAVVCSVLALLLIIGLLVFLARRRRQKRKQSLDVPPPYTQAVTQIPSHSHPQQQEQPTASAESFSSYRPALYQKSSLTAGPAYNAVEQSPPKYE